MDPPDFHPGTVQGLMVLGNYSSPINLIDERSPLPFVNDRKALPRVADDGAFAFYRPTDGLVYPMIQ